MDYQLFKANLSSVCLNIMYFKPWVHYIVYHELWDAVCHITKLQASCWAAVTQSPCISLCFPHDSWQSLHNSAARENDSVYPDPNPVFLTSSNGWRLAETYRGSSWRGESTLIAEMTECDVSGLTSQCDVAVLFVKSWLHFAVWLPGGWFDGRLNGSAGG